MGASKSFWISIFFINFLTAKVQLRLVHVFIFENQFFFLHKMDHPNKYISHHKQLRCKEFCQINSYQYNQHTLWNKNF